MDLESTYRVVEAAVASLDFSTIWPGFKPLKFALYDNAKCFFDGRYVEKTADFTANTSIVYQGEQIAIWMLNGDLSIPVLTSKLVHEMFHGYQTIENWNCWPDEIEALYRYRYDAGNLSLKLRENELLLALLDGFDPALYGELLAHRKLRSKEYPYQFKYECMVEEIEGSANFVEWQVLKQLDGEAAQALVEDMRSVMTKPESLFPIRISCYYSGALMINAMNRAGDYRFSTPERPAAVYLLNTAAPSNGAYPGSDECRERVLKAIEAFNSKTESIINSSLERNEVVLEGPLELGYVNIYNARCHAGFITSTFFLMYREGTENKLITGDFVIRMRDDKIIDKVYRWVTNE